MEVKPELTIQEKLIAIQNQIRIAIQNHQLLVAKKQMLQSKDDKIKGHLGVIQRLIINMGRKQALLLTQFRNEISAKYELKPDSTAVTAIMKKLLVFPEPSKHVPLYKKSSDRSKHDAPVFRTSNEDESDFEKINLGLNNKLNGTNMSTNEGQKILVCNKKKDGSLVLIQQSKKPFLKSKSVKVNSRERLEKLEEGRQSPESISSDSSNEVKGKYSPLRENPIEEIDLTDSPPSCKMDTRYGKKYESKTAGIKIKISCDRNSSIKKEITGDLEATHWQVVPRAIKIRHLDQNPSTIDELDQETFLSIFRLVSIEKCEVLKRKRCERKRRSVAGQSSLYSDYFQPLPKRTYTPRKPVIPVTNNAVIIESPAADDDEDEKTIKANVCTVCHEEGALETCFSCSEMYHTLCASNAQNGTCPSCTAQMKNIPNIVGANNSVGSASNLELIKRYSSDELISDNNGDNKQMEPGLGEK